MSRLGKITRRTFLVTATALAGTAAFGVYQDRRTPPNPLIPHDGESTLNSWVLIGPDGITITTPRAEMGQGIHTTLAALVAEELDVDLADIRTQHGPPAQAYFNGAMMASSLPFREYAKTGFQHALGDNLEFVGKMFSMQVTGGSTSTVDAFDRMRLAGATAREALKQAAADRTGLARSTLKTAKGQVILPNGGTIPYADLAAEAAALRPPRVTLRDPAQWKILGQSQPRVDVPAKSTGTATFGIDIRLPGMKFAALRMVPHMGGSMTGFDASAAQTMAGVEQIVDMGDGVAVIATNTWLAQQAVDAIDITWGAPTAPATTDAVFEKISQAFDEKPNSHLRKDGETTIPDGATEITAEYRLPYLAHATMEPLNATALFENGKLTIWAGNQGPVFLQKHAARELGIDTDDVTVNVTLMGGGFGRRGEFDYGVLAARLAGKIPGTPVQLTRSREQDMTHDFYRPGAVARFTGAVQNGKAVLVDGHIAAQSCARQGIGRWMGFAPSGPDKILVEGAYDQPYAIPNYHISGYLADLQIPVGFWRSVGASYNGFFMDTFMDELAHAAGRDPLEFRLELMAEEDARSAETLRTLRDMSGWDSAKPANTGRGFAFCYSFGTPVAQVIEVTDQNGEIRITRAYIVGDVGRALDPEIVRAQLVGGMVYGLSAAVFGQITFDDGMVEQQNFPDYDAVRMHNMPDTKVQILENGSRISGVGEPGTPPAMPALANALFDLTGTRARQLPLMDQFNLML